MTAKDGLESGASVGVPRRAATVLALRADLRRLREGIDRLDADLARLAEDDDPPSGRQRPERYYLVLLAVFERGPHGVSPDELAAFGADCGYDRRGLGGYFAGARAPLCTEGGRVRLTTEGNRLVHEHLGRAVP